MALRELTALLRCCQVTSSVRVLPSQLFYRLVVHPYVIPMRSLQLIIYKVNIIDNGVATRGRVFQFLQCYSFEAYLCLRGTFNVAVDLKQPSIVVLFLP